MLNLFNRQQQLLDEDIIKWIFNGYAWAFEQFDKDVFSNQTRLVYPDIKHFPGKQDSPEGMANLILKQVKYFAGMSHWPTQLINLETTNGHVTNQPPLQVTGTLRGDNLGPLNVTAPAYGMPASAMPMSSMPDHQPAKLPTEKANIIFTYHPQQLKSPAGLIAHFAQGLSSNLAAVAKELPPGGLDYLPMAGELTGIFMGFGLMFANSAIVQRPGGCGGCGGGQSPVRQVFMNEEESTYALALFCVLKSIDKKHVSKHLKKHLRGFFKAALKDCDQRLQNNSTLKLVAQGN